MTEAVIVSGVRTAIANYGGALQNTPVMKLGSIVIKEALKRAGLRPEKGSPDAGFVPEALKGDELIELEKKYFDWDGWTRLSWVTSSRRGRGKIPPARREFTRAFPKR